MTTKPTGALEVSGSRFWVVIKAMAVCATKWGHLWSFEGVTWNLLGRCQAVLGKLTQPHLHAPPLLGYGPECLQTPARDLYPTACHLLKASRIKSISKV